jgi:hypothetical protein
MKLSPSSAARRVACPGSYQLGKNYPDEESPAAREGIAAHWVASEVLRNRQLIVGDLTPNSEIITQEMLDGAAIYTEHINSKVGIPQIEERLWIYSIHPNCWGTPDCWKFDKETGNLNIWDYKFGHGYIEVFENYQLVEYVAGIIDLLNLGIHDELINVHMHIVQPRHFQPDGKIRTWSTTVLALRPYFNILKNTEALAMESHAPLNVSPACNYCRARHACPALREASLTRIDVSKSATPVDLNAEELGTELKYIQHAIRLLQARETGLSQQAISLIKSGKHVPNFILDQGYGREEWAISAEEILILGKLNDIDLSKPLETVTPKQAVAKGLPETVVKQYSKVEKRELKLKQLDEMLARKLFNR